MNGNGCGPAWLPIWAKNLLFNWFFEADCNFHDLDYELGGTEVDRKLVDKNFLAAMKRDVLAQKGLARLVRWPQAYVFYAIVRLFGWTSFNYRNK